jgi:hypothetical protein
LELKLLSRFIMRQKGKGCKMSDSFRLYRVLETKDIPAEELHEVLKNATDQEMQIDYVVGTKIILGFESMLNRKGRLEARIQASTNSISIGI